MTIDPRALRHPELGWRFDLSLESARTSTRTRFEVCAQRLLAQRKIAAFRFGAGEIAPGRHQTAVTVFAGDLLNALAVAAELEHELAGVLRTPSAPMLSTHLPMTPTGRTWARFAIDLQPESRFGHHTTRGICLLKTDTQPAQWGGEPDPEVAHRNALLALQADYRSFFTGPNFELGDIIERGRRVDCEGTRAVFGWDPSPQLRPDLGLDDEARAWWDALPGRSWRRNGHGHSAVRRIDAADLHAPEIDLA